MLMPWDRWAATATPNRPKIAPDAPTVSSCGLDEHHAERAREQRHDVDDAEAQTTERGLELRAEDPQREHVERDVEEVGVQEAAGDRAGTTRRARRRRAHHLTVWSARRALPMRP